MRIILLALLASAACSATGDMMDPDRDPGPKGDNPNEVDGGVDGEVSLALAEPVWRISSPAGMKQLPEEDVSTGGDVHFKIRGWEQTAAASSATGATSLKIIPRRGTHIPLAILGETSNTRSLIWVLSPIGVWWSNPIVWDDAVVDTQGRVLYHMLEGGLLSTTWTQAPVGTSLRIEPSAAPAEVSPGVYDLGGLRFRVVSGTVATDGTAINVTPTAEGTIQILCYGDSLYDTAEVNLVGALTTPAPGHVSVVPGPVVEKHVRFRSNALAMDSVLALGTTPTTELGPVLNADTTEIWIGSGTEATGWRMYSLATKIIKMMGPLCMRRMRYLARDEDPANLVSTQTFNYYVFSPRGTVTLWSVGRITEPYSISLVRGQSDLLLAEFPATENDYSEDLVNGRNVMSTRTAWAWDETTIIEASAMTANAQLSHTGIEGNSVDGGWRHVVNGPLSSFAVGGPGGFAPKTPPTGSYHFTVGDAMQAVFPTFSVFHRLRSWTGAWSQRENRIASLKAGVSTIFGSIKVLHNTDKLAAGSTFEVNQMVKMTDGAPEAATTLYDRYALPDATPKRLGMLDLDQGAEPTAPWDLAITGDKVGIVFAH
ncbi:MAG: hypothetical protein AB7P03_20730 [Kofleriaceae bacterium]